jgi:hypothetical protein
VLNKKKYVTSFTLVERLSENIFINRDNSHLKKKQTSIHGVTVVLHSVIYVKLIVVFVFCVAALHWIKIYSLRVYI